MAHGIVNQAFVRAPQFKSQQGPTFLVYYSPAFCARSRPATRSRRCGCSRRSTGARKLWPLSRTSTNDHAVTIRIDQIKERRLEEILELISQGQSWLLCRKNDNEAVVEVHPVEVMAELIKSGIQAEVLKFHRAEKTCALRSPRSDRPVSPSDAAAQLAHSHADATHPQLYHFFRQVHLS